MANEDQKEKNELNKQGLEILEAIKKTLEESNDSLKNSKKLIKDVNDLTEDAAKSAEKFGEGLGDSFSGLLGIGSGLSKSLSNLASKGGTATDVMNGLTGSFTKNFNAMTLAVSAAEKVIEATIGLIGATDSALVSFQKQTGAVSTYGTQIIELEQKMYKYGVSSMDAQEAIGSLVVSIKNFDQMNPTTQEGLAETTALLAEMGIDSSITGESINFLANSMGMLPEQAAESTRSMLMLAKELKTPPAEMAASFQAAQPRLAAFGNQANAVFQKLALNAHNAQMEVGDLLRITEQFDRFDTAANMVGKLNAALGGPYLSTIKMVTTTDPSERIKMMSDAARQAGKSFDSMDYYERKMLASAMGLESVNELALVMRGRFDDLVKPIELTSDQIIEQEKQLRDYNTVAEEFSQIFRSFAVNIAGPVIKGLKSMAEEIQKLMSNTTFLVAGLLTIGAALTVVSGPIAPIVTAIAGLILVFRGLYGILVNSKAFQMVLPRIKELSSRLMALFQGAGDAVGGLQSAFGFLTPYLETFFAVYFNIMLDIIEQVILNFEIMALAIKKVFNFLSDIGVIDFLAKSFMFLVGVIATVLLAFGKIIAKFMQVMNYLNPLYHLLYVGNSPSLIEVFGILGSAITSVGDALMWPIEMVMKLMTGLRDLAGLLAGKALSFIAGAISYVFSGSPEAEVNNGGFNRKEDMDSMSVSIGEEVAKAVKEALQGVQMSNKVQLEVISQDGLPTLFDFIQRGIDDTQFGRAPQHAINAARAGIGKA